MALDISVILPCRDEEKTIASCIESIEQVFKKLKLKGEIIVSDSSSDSSPQIAKKYGVKIIKHDKKGYGIACMEAISHAKGDYIIIGDADGTYDFSQLPLFVDKLDEGYDLVIGSRTKGKIKRGAMPFLHRYIGNPLLSKLLNLFFKTDISDSHSGFRAIKKKALISLGLKTTGMEFASEMIIKAAKKKLKITEVPIDYLPRIGESKLKSFSDGWRHIRFMLMFSPVYLFFIPGFFLLFLGLFFLGMMLFGKMIISGHDVSIYFSLLGSLCSILGYQIINLGLYSRIYAIHTGFERQDKLIDFIAEKMPLERGILSSLLILFLGVTGFVIYLLKGFTLVSFNYAGMLLSLTLSIIGLNTFFSAFFISMMVVEKKN
jgi:glycosyltransferase involved in cell wall biosynthesis